MNARADREDFGWALLEGERIIWTGVPQQGLRFSRGDKVMIPFSLVWCGFAIFWEASMLWMGAPLLFLLWGIPFVVLGLYFVVGRFLVDAWMRGKTRYAVTNLRILIARSGRGGNFTALSLDRLPEVQLIQQANGRGTLRFTPPPGAPRARGGRGRVVSVAPAYDPTPQFIGIEHAQEVFNRIQRAIRDGAETSSRRFPGDLPFPR